MPDDWAGARRSRTQAADPASTLSFYRAALRAARALLATCRSGSSGWTRRPACWPTAAGDVVVLLNAGRTPVPLPPGEVLLGIGPARPDGTLPADTAAGLRLRGYDAGIRPSPARSA